MEEQVRTDSSDLAEFGYKQELHRTLGSFSSFAAGFSYISILTGMFQTSFLGFAIAGPAFIWTWLLVFAGHETTKNQLGWTVAVLSEQPAIWDAVASGALPARDVVEEVLRHRSAVTSVGRTVAEPVDHAGEHIPVGTTVFLSLWSADHDPDAYPHPDQLAPADNAAVPHLAFGHGAHFCLGAALARLEIRVVLEALLARCAVIESAGPVEWTRSNKHTGLRHMPVALRAFV